MGLDDVCGDFLDMCKDGKPSSWRKSVEVLRNNISGYDYDYVTGTRRVVLALCDRLLHCDDSECDHIWADCTKIVEAVLGGGPRLAAYMIWHHSAKWQYPADIREFLSGTGADGEPSPEPISPGGSIH